MSDGEFDDELKQALLAAFGDDALLEDDGDEQSFLQDIDVTDVESMGNIARDKISAEQLDAIFPSEEMLAAQGTAGKDDFSSRIAWMKELSKKIYTDEGSAGSGVSESGQNTRVVLFAVGEQQFGLRLDDAREIARCPNITALPCTPEWLRGVTNLRGEIISVTDLRVLLGLGVEYSCSGKVIIVHCNQSQSSTAIVVDRVIGIRNASSKTFEKIAGAYQDCDFFDLTAEVDGTEVPILSIELFFENVQLQNR